MRNLKKKIRNKKYLEYGYNCEKDQNRIFGTHYSDFFLFFGGYNKIHFSLKKILPQVVSSYDSGELIFRPPLMKSFLNIYLTCRNKSVHKSLC